LVRGDPEHLVSGVVELGEVVAEVACLLRAAGGARGRVEVHHHGLAAEVGQRHGVALAVRQGEVGGRVAFGETDAVGHGRSVTRVLTPIRRTRPWWAWWRRGAG